jgi:hypothetical protein
LGYLSADLKKTPFQFSILSYKIPAGVVNDRQKPELPSLHKIQGTTPEACRRLQRMSVAKKLQAIPEISAARVAF